MADDEQLAILREGVDAWNQWREKHPDVWCDLSEAKLSGACLPGAWLSGAYLTGAHLTSAHLAGAHLAGADLSAADLSGANLDGADLWRADLSAADLTGAILGGAHLSGANLWRAKLSGADLTGAILGGANLTDADLTRAEFTRTKLGWTAFGAVDLRTVTGLDTAEHLGPSTIGIDTIYKSRGKIPDAFLRGAGVPDNFITYMGSLVGRAIEFYSCFISYSSEDQEFAERLHANLQAKGVRCWFASEDMKIGDRILDRLDRSIRQQDKLLLILSSHSIGSEWVEDEVTTAFEEERKRGKTVLFPVRLDDAVMETDEAWAAKVRGRHIGDFRGWKEHDAYWQAFERLLQDLKPE